MKILHGMRNLSSFNKSKLGSVLSVNSREFSSQAVFAQRFKKIQEEALLGGGHKRVEKQHAQHKLTARERINLLFD